MSDIIVSDGYSIVYYKNRNQIIISLPQTAETLTSTVAPTAKRKVDISNSEALLLLAITKHIFRMPTIIEAEVDE